MGSVFGFWEVFRILGSVFGFWEVFWIPGSVLDSRKCFVSMSHSVTQYRLIQHPIYTLGFPVAVAIDVSVFLISLSR